MASAAEITTSAASANFVLTRHRRTVIVGGFRYEEGVVLRDFVKEEFERRGIGGVEKVWPAGAYTTRVKILFERSNDMWEMMQAFKGIKLESELADASRPPADGSLEKRKLLHGIDRYDSEIDLGKRQNLVKDILVNAMAAKYSRDTRTMGVLFLWPSYFQGNRRPSLPSCSSRIVRRTCCAFPQGHRQRSLCTR